MNERYQTVRDLDDENQWAIGMSHGDPVDFDYIAVIRDYDVCAELVRRANLLPTVEAQLAEAVELLRRVANPNTYGDPTPRALAELRNSARAFLAKVDAP